MVHTAQHIRSALRTGHLESAPFPHLRFSNLLPEGTALGLADLDLSQVPGGAMQEKIYFSADVQRQLPLCAAVASAFQNAETVFTLEGLLDVSLEGMLLRIQYAREPINKSRKPHRGRKGKKLNLQLYLSKDLDDGTDLFDGSDHHVVTVQRLFNHGIACVVGTKSWHDFRERSLKAQRLSLNISYVVADWPILGELSFPNSPVG